MNKIFQIGFNRCATTSLFKFFKQNGLPSYHFRGPNGKKLAKIMKRNADKGSPILTGIDDKIFFSDISAGPEVPSCGSNSTMSTRPPSPAFAYAHYYKLLDEQYPDSRFILNIRNVEDWIESRARLHHGKVVEGEKRYSGVRTDQEVFSIWRNHYHSHINDVKSYFKDRAGDLLVFDIDAHSISKLIKFFEGDVNLNPKYWKVTNQRGSRKWN